MPRHNPPPPSKGIDLRARSQVFAAAEESDFLPSAISDDLSAAFGGGGGALQQKAGTEGALPIPIKQPLCIFCLV